jgi:pilus assembly protein CpaF
VNVPVMFGKRVTIGDDPAFYAATLAGDPTPPQADAMPQPTESTAGIASYSPTHSEGYVKFKAQIHSALVEAVTLTELAGLSHVTARQEIRKVIREIVQARQLPLSADEEKYIVEDVCDDMLGFGPLEPLLARDDVTDIMIYGPTKCFIEVNGEIQATDVRFRNNDQLLSLCQRMVSQSGRRVDESSPICDARLPDGSRVNVIVPPLAVHGVALTIRKFRKTRLTLDELTRLGMISSAGAELLKIIGHARCNVIISGGTSSGKTTLLNCLARYIEPRERVITCEDTAELQLQQPHVISLETRPPNTEGVGEVKMRDLVKNCLRMRPERIVVGEVRGPEAFDLLQAMNTGHQGSMGTLHANSPRDAISRIVSMVVMGGFHLPYHIIQQMICAAVDIIIQTTRLRDGSRRVTHVTELLGMEGEVITTQDLLVYEITGEDAQGKLLGRHRMTNIGRPRLRERVAEYGDLERLTAALAATD